MSATTHLNIALVEQAQAQKEVTVNQALTRIDALLNTGAKSRTTNTPPVSPVSGDLYIIGSSPTGAWLSQAGNLAYYDQVWKFIVPNTGVTLWVNDENLIYTYSSAAWVAAVSRSSNRATMTFPSVVNCATLDDRGSIVGGISRGSAECSSRSRGSCAASGCLASSRRCRSEYA